MLGIFKKIFWLFLIKITFFSPIWAKPKLTVIVVIDQFAYSYIENLKNKFNYAFKDLINNGINFTNAHHPHGTPTTATGHNALNTGTLAYKHGIVLNGWENKKGEKVRYDQDNSPNCLVFGTNGTQKYGNSAKNIMVEGLTDQFVKISKHNKSFSLSHKSRAAIGMSGKGGIPIWFDEKMGIFTTSKAFSKKMPEWLSSFNKKKNVKKIIENKKQWELFYPKNSRNYKLKDINFHYKTNYQYAKFDESLILNDAIYTSTNKISKKRSKNKKDFYDGFLKSPFANKILLDLGKYCIKNTMEKKDHMLIWISLSPLDKLGHIYGPQSIEIIDMIYHLDKQLQDFINSVKKRIDEKEILFVLTADHGVQPLVEIMQEKGLPAKRILAKKIIEEMNDYANKNYELLNLVTSFKTSQFYLDEKKLQTLSKNKQINLLNELKNIIKKHPGVANVWTFSELSNMNCKFDSYKNFYKQQLYKGRSGQLICMPEKYCIFTTYNYGTGHRSPYDYDTHVPLIIHQPISYEKKIIEQKVWIPQLAVTLARILEIPKPPASEFNELPFD